MGRRSGAGSTSAWRLPPGEQRQVLVHEKIQVVSLTTNNYQLSNHCSCEKYP